MELGHKGQGHTQTCFEILTLRQKYDAMSNVGFSVALQLLYSVTSTCTFHTYAL